MRHSRHHHHLHLVKLTTCSDQCGLPRNPSACSGSDKATVTYSFLGSNFFLVVSRQKRQTDEVHGKCVITDKG